MKTSESQTSKLVLLPPTKEQRMNRLKDAWQKIGQAEQTNAVDLDVQRATVLAEALEEETLDEKVTEQDLADAIGLSNQRISQLLRYQRFLEFFRSINPTAVGMEITEHRFRAYWQQMSDPQETRKRDPKKKTAYERSVFLGIIEWLEAGKAPIKRHKPFTPPTVAEMFTKKKPLAALRKEVERLYTEDLAKIIAKNKEYLGRDRASVAPTFQAQSFEDLERWHNKFLKLMRDFDNYVQE